MIFKGKKNIVNQLIDVINKVQLPTAETNQCGNPDSDHLARDCPSLKSPKTIKKCFNCKQENPNHTTRNCPYKKDFFKESSNTEVPVPVPVVVSTINKCSCTPPD